MTVRLGRLAGLGRRDGSPRLPGDPEDDEGDREADLADELDSTIDELFSSSDRAGYEQGYRDALAERDEQQRTVADWGLVRRGDAPVELPVYDVEVAAADRTVKTYERERLVVEQGVTNTV